MGKQINLSSPIFLGGGARLKQKRWEYKTKNEHSNVMMYDLA